VCLLCSRSISGAGNNFLPSLQRRGAFAQGFERQNAFVGCRAKPYRKRACAIREINIITKRAFSFNKFIK